MSPLPNRRALAFGAASLFLACAAIGGCNDPLHPKGPTTGNDGDGTPDPPDENDAGTSDAGTIKACDDCAVQACPAADAICRANADCVRIVYCANTECRRYDFSCLEGCAARYPGGRSAYESWANCKLYAACTSCSPSCNLPPQLCL